MSLQHTNVAVVGDVVAGAAVIASWASNVRDDLSVIVTIMAAAWYCVQFHDWWRNKH